MVNGLKGVEKEKAFKNGRTETYMKESLRNLSGKAKEH